MFGLYGNVFFHWIHLYRECTESLNKQQMYAKINSNYIPQLLLEDVISKVQQVNRFKVIFYVVFLFVSVLTVGKNIFTLKVIISPAYDVSKYWPLLPLQILKGTINPVFSVAMALCFIIPASFAIYYGFQLQRIVPEEIRHKLRKVIQLLINLISTLYFKETTAILTVFIITAVILLITTFLPSLVRETPLLWVCD
jgi:hypothetical protein